MNDSQSLHCSRYLHLLVGLLVIVVGCRKEAPPPGVAESKKRPPLPPPAWNIADESPSNDSSGDEPTSVRFRESRFQRDPDRFTAADNPRFTIAKDDVFIEDDDDVLAFIIDGHARAYPIRSLCFHHVINDMIDSKPIVITYCVICSSGIAFDPTVRGDRLTFGFYGIWQGTALLYDRQTHSQWVHISGECISGDYVGEKLQPISGRHVPWGTWKREHPDGEVMAPDPQFEDLYFRKDSAVKGLDFFPKGFLSTIQKRSSRFALTELCYGMVVNDKAKAYPFSNLQKVPGGVANDAIDGVPVVVVYDEYTQSATGFRRDLVDEPLEFEPADNHLIREQRTGSLFTVDGKCASGPLQGRYLEPVGLELEWYGWFAVYPKTEVYEPRR